VLQLRLPGKPLPSDFDREPNLAVVDSLGNLTMTLTAPPAQCPVWLSNKEVLYGVDTITHEDFGSLGIYKWNLQNGNRTAVATGAGIRFVDSSSAGIVAANYKQVFVVQGSG
jgi:hypothetical protein